MDDIFHRQQGDRQPPPEADLAAKLNGLEPYLAGRILGQGHVIPLIAELVRQAENGLTNSQQPRCKLLFLGPTGVGKTETAEAISDYIFGPNKLHVLDMSEFQHPDAVKTLIGDHSGAIGRLGEILAKHPGPKVILFDECEKAYRDIINLFLQILDKGRITVGFNTTYDLSNCYIILTSNVGSAAIMNAKRTNATRLIEHCKAEFGRVFRPELIERFQDFFVFRKLPAEIQYRIAELEIKKELAHLASKSYRLTYGPPVVNFLYQVGFHKLYGARPLRNKVQLHIRAAVSNALLCHQDITCGELTVKAGHDGLELRSTNPQPKESKVNECILSV